MNNYAFDLQKVKTLFIRESEGIYRFGDQRIQLKVEKGDKNKVLVRAGWRISHAVTGSKTS